MNHRVRAALGLTALIVGIAALAIIAGALVAQWRDDGGRPGPVAAPPASVRGDSAPSERPRASRRRRVVRAQAAIPVRIQIPSIGVDAPVIKLGLNGDGTLEVPTTFSDTGWWSGGARPGDPGPAVIVGHVDSHDGPAVFWRVRELVKGADVTVIGADGRRARFSVQGSEQIPKDAFPTERVYGATPGPTLRLVTCSGTFDQSSGHYVDNTIVYAAAA